MSNIRRRKPDYHDGEDRRVGVGWIVALIVVAAMGSWIWYANTQLGRVSQEMPPLPTMQETP